MQRTKVGIVGMGLIGKAHLDALRRLPEVEVVAVAERDDETARRAAQRYGIARWYTGHQALIGAVDVVHNCTPNALHDAVNLAAIDAGRHVYAEKPLSNTAADARMVLRCAEQKGVAHGLNHQYRMTPAVQEMRARVAGGDMGRVFLVSGRYHQQSGLYDTDYGWRMTEGGISYVLSDIGTHWADTACCVLGKRIKRVFATVRTIHPERTKPDGTRVAVQTDDLSIVLLEFEGGAQGVLTVSKVSAGHYNDLVLGVDGQHFSLLWEQETPDRLRVGYKKQPNAELRMTPQLAGPAAKDLITLPGGHPLGWNDALLASLREFYATVRGEIPQSAMRCATFEDGYEGMLFVEAAIESSRTGQWQALKR